MTVTPNGEPIPPQFGNDTACANCGDEWAGLDDKELCPDCREVWEEGNANLR